MTTSINPMTVADEIAEAVGYNGFEITTKDEIVEILNDDDIDDKVTEIAELIGAINRNLEEVERVLRIYGYTDDSRIY